MTPRRHSCEYPTYSVPTELKSATACIKDQGTVHQSGKGLDRLRPDVIAFPRVDSKVSAASGGPRLSWKIELSDLCYGDAERRAIADVLDSNWLTMGPRVEEFEGALSRYVGGAKVVLTSSCTTALQIAMMIHSIGPGDEVILPSMTFVATANVVRLAGAQPVFADIISVEEPTIDPKHVESLITKRTRAIVPMHYAGFSCRMSDLYQVSVGAEREIKIIEDAAHAFGGTDDSGGALGTVGDSGAYSFFSNKNLVTGEGGAFVTRDAALEKHARRLRSHGMTTGTWARHAGAPDYDVTDPGLNARPTEITAALGLTQLGKFATAQDARACLREAYVSQLSNLPAITIPFRSVDGEARPANHILPILLPNRDKRDRVAIALREKAIQTSHHYRPVHLLSAYADGALPLPRTETFADREMTLPLHPNMTNHDVNFVVEALRQALQT